MKTLVTNTFKRSVKKLYINQLPKLKEAIKQIQNNSYVGEPKLGDFNQLNLLAYPYNEQDSEITLLAFASHENFYRDLKKQIKDII